MKKPCKGCPYRKDNNLNTSTPGSSSPAVYIGQAMGPFYLPCHEDKNYKGKKTDYSITGHCRGAASFRTHIGVNGKMPEILSQEANYEDVFEDREAFLAHYLEQPKELIAKSLGEFEYNLMLRMELSNTDVKKLDL